VELWQLLGLLAAGAFGVGMLASSSAKQATANLARTGPPTADDLLVGRVVQAALAQEKAVTVLRTFGQKLRAAGYVDYASAIDARQARLTSIIAKPIAPALPAFQVYLSSSSSSEKP